MNMLINYVKDQEGNDLFIKATNIINESSNVFWFQDANKGLNIIAKNVGFMNDGIVEWDSMDVYAEETVASFKFRFSNSIKFDIHAALDLKKAFKMSFEEQTILETIYSVEAFIEKPTPEMYERINSIACEAYLKCETDLPLIKITDMISEAIGKEVYTLNDFAEMNRSDLLDLVYEGINFSVMPSKVEELTYKGYSVLKTNYPWNKGLVIKKSGSEFNLVEIQEKLNESGKESMFHICAYGEDIYGSYTWMRDFNKDIDKVYPECTTTANPFITNAIFFATKEYSGNGFEGIAIGLIGAKEPQIFVTVDESGVLRIIVNDDDEGGIKKHYELVYGKMTNLIENVAGHRYTNLEK